MTQPLNNQTRPFELGFYNFVDSGANPLTGEKKDPAVVMKNMLEVIELADQVGLDVFAIGEHHRVEYLASAPEVILGAAAARTKNIRLGHGIVDVGRDIADVMRERPHAREQLGEALGELVQRGPVANRARDDLDAIEKATGERRVSAIGYGMWGMGDHFRPVAAHDLMFQVPLIFRQPGRVPAGARLADAMCSVVSRVAASRNDPQRDLHHGATSTSNRSCFPGS